MFLTFGTGMGSAIFTDGKLCPGLELGHHPWREKTYEAYLGRRGLAQYGKRAGNKRPRAAVGRAEARSSNRGRALGHTLRATVRWKTGASRWAGMRYAGTCQPRSRRRSDR